MLCAQCKRPVLNGGIEVTIHRIRRRCRERVYGQLVQTSGKDTEKVRCHDECERKFRAWEDGKQVLL